MLLNLTEHASDGESVPPCVKHGVGLKGCLFFTVLSFVSLQVDCKFPFFYSFVSCSLGSRAQFLGSNFPLSVLP